MDLLSRNHEKIVQLLSKGVRLPVPTSIDVGDDVDVRNISGTNVTIYPGCRIYGARTVICDGAQIGYEGPAAVENCRIGTDVELRGGYFRDSVFLDRANMGLGAQVREACILEEEAGAAHCVGLKQTILFPFVTLGSLINFCDCLMAGGTSRKNHSEVGSSYIHFNFTPEGDKSTPSLIGDVPRGVMLNKPPVFLGGQGGLVGPLRIGFGNVVAAGSILRNDYTEENSLIVGKAYRGGVRPLTPAAYPGFSRIVANNFAYIENLAALREWYEYVRKSFLERKGPLGRLLYEGLIEILDNAQKERLKRLRTMVEKAASTASANIENGFRKDLRDSFDAVETLFNDRYFGTGSEMLRDTFLEQFSRFAGGNSTDYVGCVKQLPEETSKKGTLWLDSIVSSLEEKLYGIVPSFKETKKISRESD
jgi:bifunctional UDP-N-acetylglucosamine pyrophosphorylase / glucosamine-1-phosphate N-acetyltransferase